VSQENEMQHHNWFDAFSDFIQSFPEKVSLPTAAGSRHFTPGLNRIKSAINLLNAAKNPNSLILSDYFFSNREYIP